MPTNSRETAPPHAFLGAITRDFALVAASIHSLALEGLPPVDAPSATPSAMDVTGADKAEMTSVIEDVTENTHPPTSADAAAEDATDETAAVRGGHVPEGRGHVREGRLHAACVDFLLARPTHPISAGSEP